LQIQGTPLNQKQQEAITTPFDSPMLIIAGPGSGKTRVIVERVIHLFKNDDLKSSEILCLTFSEKAAEEMKKRLEKQIDITDMDISTFHSFTRQVLEDNILDSGIGISSGVLKRSAQLVWGLTHIDDFGFEYIEIGNNAVELIESITDGISTFKDELIFPEELEKYILSKLKLYRKNEKETQKDIKEKDFILKLSDLCKVYRKYQEFQRSKSVIDFDDMVVQCIDLLKKKSNVLQKYQQKYKHILVDEFQDNNYAQLELIKLLGKRGNVTVVGDDDQSIYRFQGAYLTNFSDYKSFFKDTKIITLNQNYRSTKNIVDVAKYLLESVPDRQKKDLFSDNEEGEKVNVIECSSDMTEVEFVVNKIRDLLNTDMKFRDGSVRKPTYNDFVVLSRRKIEGQKFYKSLKSYGIPAIYIGESNIFYSSVIKEVMMYLKVASYPEISGIELTKILKDHGISDQNISKINMFAKKRAREDPTNMDFVFEMMKDCDILEITQKNEIKEITNTIMKIIETEKKSTISELIYKLIMSLTDIYKKNIILDTPENKRNQLFLKEFYNITLEYESLNPHGTLDDFIKYINLMSKFDIELSEGFETENAIQVTTIHQSKGREFPIVFIVDVAHGKLPLRYQSKTFHVPYDLSKEFLNAEEDEKELYIQEERRLFYVAITRAQQQLYISFAKKYGQNIRETKPSKFLEELQFQNNPIIQYYEYGNEVDSTTSTEFNEEFESEIEKIKSQLQHQAVKAIFEMQLNNAFSKIIDLSKIRYYELMGAFPTYGLSSVLDIENFKDNSNIELLIQNKKIPLIDPDELRLSASSLKTYTECPMKFKFEKILQVPTPPTTYFDIGTTIHSVIEHLTKMEMEKMPVTLDLGLEILSKEWISTTFDSETQANQEKNKAKKIIDAYFKWRNNNQNSVIGAEERFELDIGGIQFTGFIDRIEKRNDGEIEVIDFKTGGVYETKNSIRENIQLNMYALAVEAKYGKLPKNASLYYLKHDKQIQYEIDTEQISKMKTYFEETVKSILEEKFKATPSHDSCRICPFQSICDAKMLE